MYGYFEKLGLNSQDIYDSIGEVNIFKIYFKKLNLKSKYKAPYREDKNGSCFFRYSSKGALLFYDYSDPTGKIVYDAINIVEIMEDLDYVGACKFIEDKFSGIVPFKSFEQKELEERKPVFSLDSIQIQQRDFSKQDFEYWSSYGITKEQLESDKVIPINSYRLNYENGAQFISCFTPSYAYTEFKDSRKKIYSPKEENLKWRTNCSQNDIGSIKHLDLNTEYLVITKSYKDCRVLRNLGINTIWFQSESQIPNKEALESFIPLYKNVYILYDNDNAGVSLSMVLKDKLKEYFNIEATNIFISKEYKDTKDISDLILNYGEEITKEFINKKINIK